MPLTIVSREDWGAHLPLTVVPLQPPAQYVFSIDTNGTPCYTDKICRFTCRIIQRFHKGTKRMMDIRYNFMIGGNGLVYEGRGWPCAPNLPIKYRSLNEKSLLVGFLGKNYTESTLPEVMLQAREDLVNYGIEHGYIAKYCKRSPIFQTEITSPQDVTAPKKVTFPTNFYNT